MQNQTYTANGNSSTLLCLYKTIARAIEMDGRHRAKDLHRVRQVPQARLTVDLGAPFAVPLPRKGNGAGSRVLFGEGKPDLKAGVTRFGLNLDVAAMLFHDPLHGV